MGTDDTGSRELVRDEESFIEEIRRRFPIQPSGDLGIGDDAAILRGEAPQVITTDLLLEGVDFFPDAPLWFVGRKALAANLSDLAAMGAEPDSFLLTLGFPVAGVEKLGELLDGMASRARASGIRLVGGDLSSSERLLISITAIGRLRAEKAILRSVARVGEGVFISRPLGGACAGLELLRKGWKLQRDGTALPPKTVSYEVRELGASLLRAQLDPEPENELGLRLTTLPHIGACIDVSDGISRDLARICGASGVGATIEWERIPIVPDLERHAISLGIDPARCALHGGEELSLLFTARGGESQLSSALGRPVYRIGTIEREPGVRLHRGGRTTDLRPESFDHFAPN